MPSIIDLYNADKKLQVSTTGDKTPYYSDEAKGTLDDKAVSSLESSIGNRYGKGVGEWGAVYSDSKPYTKSVKKD
jgi:hypothetical protein